MLFTPPSGFTGTVTFTYTIEDQDENQDTATVTLDVSEGTPFGQGIHWGLEEGSGAGGQGSGSASGSGSGSGSGSTAATSVEIGFYNPTLDPALELPALGTVPGHSYTDK